MEDRLQDFYSSSLGLLEWDVIKFVVGGEDLQQLPSIIAKLKTLGVPARRAYSPLVPEMNPAELADWVIANDPEGAVSLQLHKIIWPNTTEEV
jgi:hypothetical protein